MVNKIITQEAVFPGLFYINTNSNTAYSFFFGFFVGSLDLEYCITVQCIACSVCYIPKCTGYAL